MIELFPFYSPFLFFNLSSLLSFFPNPCFSQPQSCSLTMSQGWEEFQKSQISGHLPIDLHQWAHRLYCSIGIFSNGNYFIKQPKYSYSVVIKSSLFVPGLSIRNFFLSSLSIFLPFPHLLLLSLHTPTLSSLHVNHLLLSVFKVWKVSHQSIAGHF